MSAQAILNYIRGNYDKSKEYFEKIVTIDPYNYQMINKLGASCALLK